MNHNELGHGLSLFWVDLVISDQSSGEGKPRKGTLDNPPFWENDEFAGIRTFNDFHNPVKHPGSPSDQFSRVPTICEDMPDRGKQGKQANQQSSCADAILNAGGMHDCDQNKPHRIYRNVPLAPFDLLAGIKTAPPSFPADFTDNGAGKSHRAFVKSLGYIIESSMKPEESWQLQCHVNF